MESIGDKTRAFIYALLVHLACIAVMFIGLFWTKAAAPISVPGPIIEAELIGPSAAPKPAAARPKPAPPKPVEKPPEKPLEKPPEPPPPQPAEPPKPDVIEREKIAEIALLKAEQEKKAEEEKHKREQTLLEDQQRERLKQIEDIKRQREAAEKKRKLEQEKLAQLQDLSKQKPEKAPPQKTAPQKAQPAVPEAEQAKTGTNGNDTGLVAEYSAAIINVVKLNWNRPDNAQPGLRCTLKVIQLPGGDVMSAHAVAPCNADQVTRASIEEAVTKAQPLPYKGYEKVFARELTLIFFYDGN